MAMAMMMTITYHSLIKACDDLWLVIYEENMTNAETRTYAHVTGYRLTLSSSMCKPENVLQRAHLDAQHHHVHSSLPNQPLPRSPQGHEMAHVIMPKGQMEIEADAALARRLRGPTAGSS